MNTNFAKSHFQGADWATERPALAQVLTTLDDIYTLSLGFVPDVNNGETGEGDMLKTMSLLAQTALQDLDLLSADLMPSLLQCPQAGWSAFEARELLTDLLMLCAEAQLSMKHKNAGELPRALAFELGYLTGRIKELVKTVDV